MGKEKKCAKIWNLVAKSVMDLFVMITGFWGMICTVNDNLFDISPYYTSNLSLWKKSVDTYLEK